MAQSLKPSEVKLLAAFGGTLFILANLWGWGILNGYNQKADLESVRLNSDIAKFKALKQQAPLADQYQGMLEKWVKAYTTLDQRDVYLGSFVKELSDKFGLELSKNIPTEVIGEREPEAKFIITGYTGVVRGDWKKVMEFSHNLEDVSDFRWVKEATFTTMKNEAQDGNSDLELKFSVQKWWDKRSEEILAENSQPAATGLDPASPSGAPVSPNPTAPIPTPAAPEQPGAAAVESGKPATVAAGQDPTAPATPATGEN
jgi:hypothetical protein